MLLCKNVVLGSFQEHSAPFPYSVIDVLPPDALIISKQPMASSSSNHIKGVVTGISPMGANVELEIAAGEKLVAQITCKSYASLNVDIGADVYVTFKASDVYVFRADQSIPKLRSSEV